MQPLSRGAPCGAVVVSPLPNQRITAYSNLIKLKVCSSLKFIPNVVKQSSTLMVTKLVKINSLIHHKIRPLVKVIIAYFIDVHDVISTEVDGMEFVRFFEKNEWFGLTIKTKNGDPVYISKVDSNTSITKLDHKMKNGNSVEMNQVKRIRKEIRKIFEEEKDLEQEGSFVVEYHLSCFTKTDTHENYFTIRDALLLKLHKLVETEQPTSVSSSMAESTSSMYCFCVYQNLLVSVALLFY
ncbi:hypothetical protein MKX01_018871 [Papaver californicum]|nr:hypothetical protein MKX01_018871 [Papaver californicum]